MKITEEIQEFLRESNAIESVHDDTSFQQAKRAWEYLMTQKNMTTKVVLGTHNILMLGSNLDIRDIGSFRNVGVMVGGYIAINPLKIPEAMESWCEDANTSVKVPSKEGKHIKLDHITYEKIHPFIDGNGRTGRMFMNWQRIRAKLPILIVHVGKEQMEYYKWFK